MVNFSRSHKTTYAATNRTSVASNLTTQSNRTGTHSSFIAAAAKRVVSAFEPRVSWATTSTAHTMEDKEHQGLLVPPPPPTSESASTHSAEESKRHRKRGPKITAMLTMFEQKHSSEADKENVGEKDQFASKVSVLATSPTVTKSCETARIPHAIEDKIPYSIMEKTNSKTMSDLIAPLPTKSSKVRKLRSMASKMELTIKREKSVRDATYSAQEQRYQIDKSIAKSWDDKVDALAAWSTVSLTNGFMDRPDLKTLMTANDVPSEGCMPTSNRAAKLLTPEQDLIECFSPDRCLPHLAAYFAKILNEAKSIQSKANVMREGFAKEVYLALVYHECRVPLVFRIESVHGLVEYEWPDNQKELIYMAWNWCHQLRHTGLMLALKVKTMALLNKIAPDERLPDLEPAPCEDGM